MGMYDKYHQEWLDLYNKEEKSLREIGRLYGVDQSRVAYAIKKYQELRPRGVSKEYAPLIYSLYRQGYNGIQIADKLNIKHGSVAKTLLTEYGIRLSVKPLKYDYLKDNFIRDYYGYKMSLAQIASKYHVSRQTVLNYINSADLKAREYTDALKTYESHDKYFDEITPEKSFTLGVLYASAIVRQVNTAKYINISMRKEYEQLLSHTVGLLSAQPKTCIRFMDKSTSSYTRIHSTPLYLKLKAWGLGEHMPCDLLYQKSFYDGYLLLMARCGKKALGISTRSKYGKDIASYLINTIGVTSLVTSATSQYRINRESDVVKVLKRHTIILPIVEAYIRKNPENTYWPQVMEHFK